MRIRPQGCTPVYASPQLLRAKLCQLEHAYFDSEDSDADSEQSSHSRNEQVAEHAAVKGNKLLRRLSPLWKKLARQGANAAPPMQAKPEPVTEPANDSRYIDGPAADVWSAGVVLFEMVCACEPSAQHAAACMCRCCSCSISGIDRACSSAAAFSCQQAYSDCTEST